MLKNATGNLKLKLVFSCFNHSQSQPKSSTLMVMEPIQDLGIILINREKIGGYM